MMKKTAIGLIGLLSILGATAAGAEDVKPSPQDQETKAVQAYGDDNKTCGEWTDGCVICKRSETEVPACSLPGIACLPKSVSCTAPVLVPPGK